jgi:plasmid stability protein
MSTLTVRDLDEELKARLRVRAAGNGRSTAAEVRAILRSTLFGAGPDDRLGTRNVRDFEATGIGVADPWVAA